MKEKKDFNDLIEIIKILRSPQGCPWDREQTHKSMQRQLVEECYEVLDAINEEDMSALKEELGDILLHVVFHSLIAKENNEFDISDVIDGICQKMIGRHPHVFDVKKDITSDEVLDSWDERKKKEKGFETVTDEMNAVARALPALTRSAKIQKKASKVGFDFENVEQAMAKIEEELNEIKDVYKTGNLSRIEEEVGDLLFSAVNVGRFLKVDCEEALEKTTNKFVKRFSFIEEAAIAQNKNLDNMGLEEMDELWELVKQEKNV